MSLPELKRALVSMRPDESDNAMSRVMSMFFDLTEQHLSEGGPPWGESFAAAELGKLVASIVVKILGRPVVMGGVFFRVAEAGGFVHGSAEVGDGRGEDRLVMFWFDDPGVGLLCLSAGGGMHFARFRPVHAPSCPSVAGRN